jgi:hypothetical protein
MAQESSFQLPRVPTYPQAVITRFPELKEHQRELQIWSDQVGRTIRQEIDRLNDRIAELESAS